MIQGIVEKPVAGVCGVTDLMTEEGHRGLPSRGESCDTLKVRLRDGDVKRRKDELFGWDGVTD
jgi:hypothetical protein